MKIQKFLERKGVKAETNESWNKWMKCIGCVCPCVVVIIFLNNETDLLEEDFAAFPKGVQDQKSFNFS